MGDQRLVELVRDGNETAFEVVFERHASGILSFCRHMLGSREEAEDAVQHVFAAAYHDLLRDEREIVLKPWLYAIARNRCLSLLRARREQPVERCELPTAGLTEQVEQRAELRQLLVDVSELPDEQREALLLAQISGLSHAEAADVLGCQARQVKALVYRARSALIERRDARETPCEEIREQLATLRGGSLRRNLLRRHLQSCASCRTFGQQVKQQRSLLGAALPVLPAAGLRSAVFNAVGLGGGSAGGGAAIAALGTAGVAAPIGSTLAKVAIVSVLAAGGAVTADAVVMDPGPAVAPHRSLQPDSTPSRLPRAGAAPNARPQPSGPQRSLPVNEPPRATAAPPEHVPAAAGSEPALRDGSFTSETHHGAHDQQRPFKAPVGGGPQTSPGRGHSKQRSGAAQPKAQSRGQGHAPTLGQMPAGKPAKDKHPAGSGKPKDRGRPEDQGQRGQGSSQLPAQPQAAAPIAPKPSKPPAKNPVDP